MKITYEIIKEKFIDKGMEEELYCMFIPFFQPPIFDPSCLSLQLHTREFLYEDFKKSNKWAFDWQQEKLEDLNTWIEHQKHK